jgi:hypothetical protein
MSIPKKLYQIHPLPLSSSCLLASLISRTKVRTETKATIVRRKKIILSLDAFSERKRNVRQAPKIIQLRIRSMLNMSNLKNFFISAFLRGSLAPSVLPKCNYIKHANPQAVGERVRSVTTAAIAMAPAPAVNAKAPAKAFTSRMEANAHPKAFAALPPVSASICSKDNSFIGKIFHLAPTLFRLFGFCLQNTS